MSGKTRDQWVFKDQYELGDAAARARGYYEQIAWVADVSDHLLLAVLPGNRPLINLVHVASTVNTMSAISPHTPFEGFGRWSVARVRASNRTVPSGLR